MEFGTKHDREIFLRQIKENNLVFLQGDKQIKIKPAQTRRQRTRSYAVNKACEMIKADARSRDKNVVVSWTTDGNKGKRQILVNDVLAFEQVPADALGAFKGAFTHLQFP